MKSPNPWTVGNWLALTVPNSLVVANCTKPRSTLSPIVKLFSRPKTFSEDAAWTEPPKLLLAVQVRSISPRIFGKPSAPEFGTVCPLVVVRGDTVPSRLGKHSTADCPHTVGSFDAFVPLPSTWA